VVLLVFSIGKSGKVLCVVHFSLSLKFGCWV
jgi:hypothetical protein